MTVVGRVIIEANDGEEDAMGNSAAFDDGDIVAVLTFVVATDVITAATLTSACCGCISD